VEATLIFAALVMGVMGTGATRVSASGLREVDVDVAATKLATPVEGLI